MKTKQEYLELLNPIFIDVFENDDIKIFLETSSKDIEEWDSLTHIQLIVEIEKYFKIRFSSKEIQSWSTVDELIETIIQKITQ